MVSYVILRVLYILDCPQELVYFVFVPHARSHVHVFSRCSDLTAVTSYIWTPSLRSLYLPFTKTAKITQSALVDLRDPHQGPPRTLQRILSLGRRLAGTRHNSTDCTRRSLDDGMQIPALLKLNHYFSSVLHRMQRRHFPSVLIHSFVTLCNFYTVGCKCVIHCISQKINVLTVICASTSNSR